MLACRAQSHIGKNGVRQTNSEKTKCCSTHQTQHVDRNLACIDTETAPQDIETPECSISATRIITPLQIHIHIHITPRPEMPHSKVKRNCSVFVSGGATAEMITQVLQPVQGFSAQTTRATFGKDVDESAVRDHVWLQASLQHPLETF